MPELPCPVLPHSAASERNRQPILEALKTRLPSQGNLLEIGAGSGQHAVWMAPHFPRLNWLVTDRQAAIPGLRARVAQEGCANIPEPVVLDVMTGPWPQGPFDAAFSANTAHIMAMDGVKATFRGVAQRLNRGGLWLLYGPFNIDGQFTAPGNEAFDQALKNQDPEMGIRDMGELELLAQRHQMVLEERVAMPANNFLLVFRKQ